MRRMRERDQGRKPRPNKEVKLGEDLSPELHQILLEEAIEGEIEAAVDAALEEGHLITRDEAIDLLRARNKERKNKLS